MTDTLHPYPEYKDSGQTWLGQVPRHWPVLPNRAIFDEVKDREHPDEEMLSVTITRGIVRQKALLADSSKKDSSNLNKSAYKLVQPRDIAYNKMRAWQGAIAASELRGIISPAYVVMRLREDANLPRYFHHLYRTPLFAKEAERWSYGITSDMWSLRPEHFKVIYTPLPPPDEQAAIVRFLDHANGRLERAIRAKHKIITLLNEQKQAIIASLVTGKCEVGRVKSEEGREKGEDGSDISLFTPRPSPFMKPSGIPWLGDIPQHWDVSPLKGVCTIQSGITLGKDYEGQSLREYPYLRVANVQAGHTNLTVMKKIRVTKAEAERCLLQRGDVLMTEGGDPDKLGRGCVWEEQVNPCLHQNHVFAVRPNQSRLVPNFLAVLMGTSYARAYFQSTSKQTTNLASTNKTKIGMFKVLLPSIDEQCNILSALKEETRPVSTAISNFEREIALLREFRTRLTADVVTGKLDVRREKSEEGRVKSEEGRGKGEEGRVKGEGDWGKEDEAEALETEEGGEDE